MQGPETSHSVSSSILQTIVGEKLDWQFLIVQTDVWETENSMVGLAYMGQSPVVPGVNLPEPWLTPASQKLQVLQSKLLQDHVSAINDKCELRQCYQCKCTHIMLQINR